MKFSKLFAIGSLLAAAFLFASTANAAPTVVFAGAGSSAVFNSLYDAALNSGACGTNLWSAGAGTYPGPFLKGGTVHDNRNGFGTNIPDDNNKIWVAFDGTAANNYTDTTVICLYIAVDSSVGIRGFLAGVRASAEISSSAGAAAGSQVKGYADNVATLPQAIWNDVNVPTSACVGTTLTTCTTVTGTTMNAAGADIRPEDAQYATYRALSARAYNGAGTTPTNPTYYSSTNLGYGDWFNPYEANSTLAGTSILSSFSTTAATPIYFEQVVGAADAIHGTVGEYAVYPLGAEPILVFVSNSDSTANTGFGSGAPGNYQLKNADRFNLSYVFDGTFTRTRDLMGVVGSASVPMEVIQREPLSGTYNTFEFSVPRTHDVQNSQEDGVWPSLANYNPLNVKAPGSNGLRFRAIGTGEEVNAINGLATTVSNTIVANRIGYAFWSYANVSALAGTSCTSTVPGGIPVSATVQCSTTPGAHYLLIDGVDPLFNTPYDNPQGPLNPPTCNFASLPCPTIPFTHIKDGSYSAWNVIRLVVDPTQTTIQTPVAGCSGFTGINAIYCTFETVSAAKYSDILPASNLSVFRDHKGAGWGQQGIPANGYGPVNGTMCAPPLAFGYNYTGQDMGSDVGGAIFNITADQDYAFDYQGGLTPANNLCGQSGGANVGLVGQVQ
jgi:hypothetical protein